MTTTNLYKEINFSDVLEKDPQLQRFLKESAKQIGNQEVEFLRKAKKPTFDQELQNHLIVTGIPELNQKNFKQFSEVFRDGTEKKTGLLKSKKISKGIESIQFGYRMDGETLKFNQTVHMIYQTAAQAKQAYHKLNNVKFDKKHTLFCFTVKQFQNVQKIKDNYKDPNYIPKEELVQYNCQQNHIDQFIFREKRTDGNKLNLNWFDYIEKKPQPALQEEHEKNKTISPNASKMVWSPKGSYLAICQIDGVRLYGGKNMKEKAFYEHKGILNACFSPNQTFLVTFNGNDGVLKSSENLILWGVEEQIKIRSFRANLHQDLSSFQWTQDQKRLAFVGNDCIFFYNSSSVSELKTEQKLSEEELEKDKKLIQAKNIQKISWLPDLTRVVCICYETDPLPLSNSATKIFFYNTKTAQIQKWKAIGQHIKKVEITISNNHDWIAVSYKKLQKKNLVPTTIQIVDLTKKQIETQIVEFKDNVGNISWDKKFGRFAVTCEDSSTIKSVHIKFHVYFYQKDKNQQFNYINEVNLTSANRVMLPENGKYFALYNISANSSGRGKFSIGYFSSKKIEFVKENTDIAYMNFFTMDITGRFILLGTDKSYQIWSLAGEMLHKDIFTQEIYDVQFRPRYISQLSREKEKQLQQKEKKIKQKYDQLDKEKIDAIEAQRELQKNQKRKQFMEYLKKKVKQLEPYKEIRQKILGFNESEVKTSQYIHLSRQKN